MLPKVDLRESIWRVLNVKMRSHVASKYSKDLTVCPDLLVQLSLQ